MEATEVERQLLKSYQKSRMDCEAKAVNAIKKNPKYFFSYARKFSSVKIGIGPFVDAANKLLTNSLRMAEMLSEQYKSVYSTPKESLPETKEIFQGGQTSSHWLHNVTFDKEDIKEAIDQISSTASAGPDRFPMLFLKMCKQSLAKPLFIMWRKSLDTGEIPPLLKIADAVPIFKNGNRGVPSNYWPVALTSHLIKVFEKVLPTWKKTDYLILVNVDSVWGDLVSVSQLLILTILSDYWKVVRMWMWYTWILPRSLTRETSW